MTRNRTGINALRNTSLASLWILLNVSAANAQSLPWESTLQRVRTSIEGPVATGFVVLGIVGSGFAYLMGESGSVFKKCAAVALGGAFALGAAQIVSTLFV